MKNAKRKYPEHRSETLEKALLILETFCSEQTEWGIRELARKLKINPTTTFRILTTFANDGYLERNSETQRYSLGPKVLKLSNVYTNHNPFPKMVHGIFERFADRFEHNFYLGYLIDQEVIYLAALDGRGPIRIIKEPGSEAGLHSTALGKVLLAYQDDEYINTFMKSIVLERFTERTMVEPEKLWAQILEIRVKGYAINDGEYYEDIGAIGFPILESGEKVTLALSFAYPRHQLLNDRINLDELINLAREIVQEIRQVKSVYHY